jgi:hypothetical protein
MQPRLSTSSKWTAFPEDLTQKILQVFTENFPIEADAGEFLIEGRIYAEEVLLRVGYLEHGRLRQINFEASKEYSSEKQDAFKMIYLCVDALGATFEEYFDNTDDSDEERLDFPLYWQPFEFDDGTVYLQHSTDNTRLDAEADRLLEQAADKALVHEEAPSEDALSRALIDNDLAFEVQKEIRKGSPLN